MSIAPTLEENDTKRKNQWNVCSSEWLFKKKMQCKQYTQGTGLQGYTSYKKKQSKHNTAWENQNQSQGRWKFYIKYNSVGKSL